MPDADYVHGDLEPDDNCAKCDTPRGTCMMRVEGYRGYVCWPCFKAWREIDKPTQVKKGKR